MPYFLSQKNLKLGEASEIIGEEARHILLSHRAKAGEKIKIQSANGQRFNCEILSVKPGALIFLPQEALPAPQEPNFELSLVQAVVSEKALDFIFQKATELGVKNIVLVNSSRTATKLNKEMFKKKIVRWNKILLEAAKQSERAVYPILSFVSELGVAVQNLKTQDTVFLASVDGQPLIPSSSIGKKITLIVGPEGGFSKQELESFSVIKNLKRLSLSPFILRSETAALAGMAVIANILL